MAAAKDAPGTELAPGTTGLPPAKRAELEIVRRAILGEAELPQADPQAMSRAILERILASSSFEEAHTQQNLTPWRTMLDRTVIVQYVHFNRSSFEGQALYAVCDLIDAESGESISVTCGGQNVLGQLYLALDNGWYGQTAEDPGARPVRMIENKTSEGYGALWLEAA